MGRDAPSFDLGGLAGDDVERRTRATLLKSLLIVSLIVVVCVAFTIPTVDSAFDSTRRLALAFEFVLISASLLALRLGHPRPVAAIYCALQWLALAVMHGHLGLDPGIVGLGMINLSLMAGLTAGPAGGLILAVLSTVWVPTVAWLQARGVVAFALDPAHALERVAGYAGCMLVSTYLVGYGLARLRYHLRRNLRAHARLQARVRQSNELAELSELVVRAPTPGALHRGVVERVAAIMPGHQVALYHARRRRYALSACVGDASWPDRLPNDLLRELQRDESTSPDELTASAVIELDSLGDDGLPEGHAQLIPIRLGEDLSGALVIVSESNDTDDPSAGLLRTVASLVAAGNDRHGKDSELRQAQKMEAVGQLAGGVAHDFNNLLTSVIGSATLAREHINAPDKVMRMLGDIERAGEHAAMLTRQMLQFSRRQAVRPDHLCVHEVVESLDGMLRRLLPETITLETRLSEQRGIVHADRHAIEQLVWNLVLNARDAVGEAGGSIRLGVAIEPTIGPHGATLLTVADDGCGMDQETIDRIFEPFFTTKASGQGTGLGLATVRRVVENLGGEIAIDSKPGRGTRFTVTIPLSRPIELGTAPTSILGVRAENSRELRPRAREGETVLLVEDHELVRKSLRALLESAGYQVACVPDGQAALEELSRREGISAVVSDVVMPRLTGDELVRIMRRRGDETPVVLLTGYADERLRGADPELLKGVPLLDKPVSATVLLRQIRHLVDRRQMTRNEWSSPSIRVDSFSHRPA